MSYKKIVIGNWKMAPRSMEEARATFMNIKGVAGKVRNVQTVVCSPAVFISELQKKVSGHRCVLGAQDLHWEKVGAYTGCVSGVQLAGAGAQYVIIGHSERRSVGETDDEVAKKTKAALQAKLVPVVCFGELERDEGGAFTKMLRTQIKESLDGVTRPNAKKIVLAYEPVWAIGKDAKREPTSDEVLEISIFVRKVLADLYGEKIAYDVPLLYGGSVSPQNAQEILVKGQ